jgi:hypothetical protein
MMGRNTGHGRCEIKSEDDIVAAVHEVQLCSSTDHGALQTFSFVSQHRQQVHISIFAAFTDARTASEQAEMKAHSADAVEALESIDPQESVNGLLLVGICSIIMGRFPLLFVVKRVVGSDTS